MNSISNLPNLVLLLGSRKLSPTAGLGWRKESLSSSTSISRSRARLSDSASSGSMLDMASFTI